jgi:hypothetical protein
VSVGAAEGVPAAPEPARAVPDPEFEIVSARPMRHAAAPAMLLDLQVSEPSGRQIYMIALRMQLMIDSARRGYDDATRARLMELFGAPERWAVTTRSLVLAQLDVLVPAFTGSTTVTTPLPCTCDLELATTRYLNALPDGFAPLGVHFNGTIYYPDEHGGLQMVLVPWSKSIDYRLPVSVWRETVAHYYPNTGWFSVRSSTLEALQDEKLRRGLATLDDTVSALLYETGGDD